MSRSPARPLRTLVTRMMQIVAIAGTAVAVSGGTCEETPTSPGFDLFPGPTPAPVAPGGTGTVDITIVRKNGLTESITFRASTTQVGGSDASIVEQTVPNGVGTVRLQFVEAQNATPGHYTLHINASTLSTMESDDDARNKNIDIDYSVVAASSFTLSSRSAQYLAVPGGTRSLVVTIARDNFTAPVLVSATPPSPLTANITVDGTGTSAVVVISVPANATEMSYPFTITGSSGSTVRTLNLIILVTGLYTVDVSPLTLTVQAGNRGSATANITQKGVPGAVAISARGAPAGVVVVATPSPTTGTQSTLDVGVASTVVPGTYAFEICGDIAPTQGCVASEFNLVVTPAGSYTFTVQTVPLNVVAGGPAVPDNITINRSNFGQAITITGTSDAGIEIVGDPTPVSASATLIFARALTGATVGTHTVTLTGSVPGNPDYQTTFALVVAAPPANPVASVVLAPATISMNVGDAAVLETATLKDAGGQPTTGTLGWSADASTVASVTPVTTGGPTANVTAVSPGVTAVTALNAASGLFGRALVRVAGTSGIARLLVSPFHISMALASTHPFTVQGFNKSNTEILPAPTVTWSSSNATVASVDPVTGVVTANSAGGAIITATRDGQTSTGAVTVGAHGAIKGTLSSTSGQYLAGAKATARQGGVIVGVGTVIVDPGTNQFYLPGIPAGSTQVTIEVNGYTAQVITALAAINQTVLLPNAVFP